LTDFFDEDIDHVPSKAKNSLSESKAQFTNVAKTVALSNLNTVLGSKGDEERLEGRTRGKEWLGRKQSFKLLGLQ